MSIITVIRQIRMDHMAYTVSMYSEFPVDLV